MIVDIWQNSRTRNIMRQSAASPWGSPPGTTENPGTFVKIVRYLLPEVVGKISLLFIEIAPQGADPGDLLVSGIRYRRFPDVVRGVHFAPLSHEF